MKEGFIFPYSAIYEDMSTGEKSEYRENDILDLHNRVIYVTVHSGHSNYMTRKGNNPKLDPYADYDHICIDLFNRDVYSVTEGFNLFNLKLFVTL